MRATPFVGGFLELGVALPLPVYAACGVVWCGGGAYATDVAALDLSGQECTAVMQKLRVPPEYPVKSTQVAVQVRACACAI